MKPKDNSESFADAIKLFGMRVNHELGPDEIKDPEKREKLLKNLREEKSKKNNKANKSRMR